MTTVAIVFAAASAVLAAWSYIVYPALMRRLARRTRPDTAVGPAPESVEVVVSAADEESVIGQRIANLLTQDVPARYRVTVGCDGAADQTAQRAREAGDSRVSVVEFVHRRGKAAVINDLVSGSEADVIVFTDANTHFEPGAIECLTASFVASDVGAACGRLLLQGSEAESLFWDRETRLKESEGRLGICLGANGAIYAARREDISPLPSDTAMDDFLIPVRIARRGRRVVFVGDAVAREETSGDVRREMARRFRIGVGAGQVMRRELWLWAFWRHPLITLAYVSRKVARWLAPVMALLSVAAACASSDLREAGIVLAAAAALLALSSLARPHPRGLPGRLYYFAVINLALSAGVLAGLAGLRRAIWKPDRS
jgi:cellulose synthase/poly-beta-1,6-N-acetylglucosamine synthase-like glycosyltransferase